MRLLPLRHLKPSAIAIAIAIAAGAAAPSPSEAQSFTSQANGNWNGGATVWSPAPPANGPQTGAGQTAIIDGHDINYPGGINTGGSGGSDLTLGNGGLIQIANGGLLRQDGTTNWMRLGDGTSGPGTLTINDGTFRPITPGNVVVGTRGGTGIVDVGDGSGAAGSALLDLQTANRQLNLGEQIGGLSGNATLTVRADGLIEGGNQTIRIGRNNDGAPVGSPWQSSLTIQDGGRFNARAAVEFGSGTNAVGSFTITGTGSLLAQSSGDFVVGWNGIGTGLITGGGAYTSSSGDFRIGFQSSATGTVTVSQAGTVTRTQSNWANLGQAGTGTLNLESGGQWRELGSSNFRAGMSAGASGTINLSGPTYNAGAGTGTLLETHQLAIADNGTATVNQSGGTVISRGGMWLTLGSNGSSTYNMSGGELIANQWLVVSENGTTPASPNATLNLSGNSLVTHTNASNLVIGANNGAYGRVTMADAATINTNREVNVGRFAGSRGELLMSGGTFNHSGNTLLRIGESGRGTVELSGTATFTKSGISDTRVGENSGSQGSLLIDGATFSQTGGGDFRVGFNSGATGEVTIRNGGLLQRSPTNWANLGQSGAATLNLESGGQWRELGASEFQSGMNAGASATFNISGPTYNSGTGTGTLLDANRLAIGVNGTALVNQSGGTVIARGGTWLTLGANGSSTYNMSGGELISNRWLVVSETGTSPASPNATLNLSGSALVSHTSSDENFVIGAANGSYGRVTMADSATINSNRPFIIGRLAGSRGELLMSGGTINHTAPASGNSDFFVGQGGIGLLDIGAGATVNRTHFNWAWVGQNGASDGTLIIRDGGTWNSSHNSAQLRVANATGSSGSIRVEEGGTLTNLGQINLANAGSGGDATLIVNGTLNSNNPILVGSGAGAGSALLGGTGTVNANTTLGARGTLAPGDPSSDLFGTLNLSGNLLFEPGSTWLTAVLDQQASLITLSGTLGDLSGTSLTASTASGGALDSPIFILDQITGAPIASQFANTIAPAGAPDFWTALYPTADGFVSLAGRPYAIFYSADLGSASFTGGFDIALGAIPEPSRALLLGLASLPLLLRRRRP